jgi:hypothetical protein
VEQREYCCKVKDHIISEERRKRRLHVWLNEKFFKNKNKRIMILSI